MDFGGSFGGSNYCNIEGQIMNLKNKYISIIGAGESGVGAALLAKKIGADVFVSDFSYLGKGNWAYCISWYGYFMVAWEMGCENL